MSAPTFSEADLCAAFIASATEKPKRVESARWVAYPETGGFDIVLVRETDGVQIGIEAKLVLNARVLVQALPERGSGTWTSGILGPDYRAVLVPATKCNSDIAAICEALGITVIAYRGERGGAYYGANSYGPAFTPGLPSEGGWSGENSHWHEWAPLNRLKLPDYIPDVIAGASAPVALTAWKVKAIRLSVLLDERPVTRADFKHLELSPTSWLSPGGWLDRTPAGWIRGPRTPDFEVQHPRNYGEIAADKARWAPKAGGPLFADPAPGATA